MAPKTTTAATPDVDPINDRPEAGDGAYKGEGALAVDTGETSADRARASIGDDPVNFAARFLALEKIAQTWHGSEFLRLVEQFSAELSGDNNA